MSSSAARPFTPVVVLGDGVTYAPFGGHLALLPDAQLKLLDEGTPISSIPGIFVQPLGLRELLMFAAGKAAPSPAQKQSMELCLTALSGR